MSPRAGLEPSSQSIVVLLLRRSIYHLSRILCLRMRFTFIYRSAMWGPHRCHRAMDRVIFFLYILNGRRCGRSPPCAHTRARQGPLRALSPRSWPGARARAVAPRAPHGVPLRSAPVRNATGRLPNESLATRPRYTIHYLRPARARSRSRPALAVPLCTQARSTHGSMCTLYRSSHLPIGYASCLASAFP